MQSVYPLVQLGVFPELLKRAAEPRTGEAGIVDVRFYLAVLRIHAYPRLYVTFVCAHSVAELRPLPRGVEHHVIADFQQFVEVLLRVRRGEHVILAPERLRHLLIAELCFEYAAGGHAVEVLCYQRVDRERRERFLRQQYLTARLFAD